MAQDSPSSVDVQDIQFKLHDKWNAFSAGAQLRSNVNLLAVSSSQGLLFVGSPCVAEFKVMLLKDVVECKTDGRKMSARLVQLPHWPNSMAVSCDGNMLAVNYTLNGSAFLQIYSVASFMTPNIKLLYNIRLSPEENVSALQIIWNPVLSTNLAVVLDNGALDMFTLKDSNNYDFHSLDKQLQVRCGCWSPKGKQIVLGFGEGKLQQYKPDLTPAKTITCPAGVHPGPFDTLAVHWLSTFQFVVAFLQQGPDQSPSLYIVNAPKGGAPVYINYYDICYSSSGPRIHQMNFTHIQQWNLLLATSANGVEVGILGTRENGDTPSWQQYMLLDEARIEMPLTEEKEETYPIGFAFDTSVSHQLVIGEKKLPAMPMVHVLSTHGHLVSFNFLNLSGGAVDVCSPPPPITDSSGQFRPLENLIELKKVDSGDLTQAQAQAKPQAATSSAEMSFAFNPNAVTSTPAKEKSKPLFGNTVLTAAAPNESTFSQGVNSTFSLPKPTATQPPSFGSFNLAGASKSQFATTSNAPTTNMFAGFGNSSNTFGGLGAKAAEQPKPVTISQTAPQQSSDLNKPLYTVPATFTPPTTVEQQQKPVQQQQRQQQQKSAVKPQMNNNEIDDIVKQMIAVQINSFNMELQQLGQHSQGLLSNIGKPDEMKSYTKRLHDLQEIVEQANDRDFEMDMQNLRHSLMESYAMLAECRTKLDMYNNPEITRLTSISTFDPINRRQLAKLQSSVAANKAQMQQLQQQIDAQWASYQDLVRRNSKTKMHIPCLDGIYQRMTKLKDLITRQRTKLNCIKEKLKQKGLIMSSLNELDMKSVEKQEGTMESLADSILSMSLGHVVDATQSKLSKEKLNAIRNFVRDRQICHIKPHRPDRVGLKSEVILETKLQTERQSREGAVTSLTKMQQEKIPIQSNSSVMTKPTATKPTTSMMGQSMTSFVPPASTNTTSTFGFGGTSPFVKTGVPTPVVTATKAPVEKSEINQKSFAGSAAATGFIGLNSASAATVTNSAPKFGQAKNVTVTKMEPPSNVNAQPPPQAPISFSAKVVSSENAAKPPTSTFSFSKPESTQDKDIKKLGETEIPKTFSFGGVGIPGGTNLFSGSDSKATFGVSALNVANVAPFGGFNTSKASPFDGKPGSGFNFGGVGASVGSASTSGTSSAATTTSNVTKPFNLNFSGFGDSKAIAGTGETTSSTTKTAATAATTAATTSSAKEPIFKGQGKPVGSEASTTTSSSTAMSTGAALNLSAQKTEPAAASVTTSLSTQVTTNNSSSAVDSILGSLNICKPTTQDSGETQKNTGNAYGASSFSFTDGTNSGDGSKSIFGGTGTGGNFPFGGTAATTTTATTNTTPSTITTAPVKPVVVPSTSAAPFSLAGFSVSTIATSPTPVTTLTEKTTSSLTTTTPAATTASVTSSIFGSPAPVSSAVPSIFGTAAVTASTAVTQPSTTPTSLFGGSTSNFGTSTSIVTTPNSTSIFGAANAASVAVTSAPSLFSTVAAPTTSSPSSIYDSTTAVSTTTSGNIFGGIPKPEQSLFSSPTSPTSQQSAGIGLFAAAAAANPSPFSSPNAATGGSIFGGGSSSGFGTTASATPTTGSIFGGGSTNASSPFAAAASSGGSIFGGVGKPVEGGNIFGSPTQPAASATGGSIFGQSSFGQSAATAQSGTSLFGAGTQQQSSGFGGSIFGGGSTNTASGGSIFGGGSANSIFGQSPGGFGSFSQPTTAPAFGLANSGGGGSGSFAQGGTSVAQSGFGSPQQGSSFSQPIFGGAATFGSPPAFGAQPSFGGAATFGSPKGFGSFATPSVAAAPASATSGFTVQTQKNSLFEALGSTDSGLSFGNLAQNTNVNPPKPTFGGSSFMNYRA